MNRNLFLWLVLAALLFGMSDASAQKRAKKEKYNYEITIVLEGVPDTMLYIGYYYADKTYSLITFLNQEGASGTDNLSNVTVSSNVISELSSGQNAILLIPQCPSGTWTGLAVKNGNYSTAEVSETAVMKAVAAMIRDVSERFKTVRNYAVGIDAGAYAVSDLLVRHKDLLAAGIVIAGAGDPSADIGGAKAWIIHASGDDLIPQENADALAKAWNAEYTCYEWGVLHDCWDKAIQEENLLDWLLSK